MLFTQILLHISTSSGALTLEKALSYSIKYQVFGEDKGEPKNKIKKEPCDCPSFYNLRSFY